MSAGGTGLLELFPVTAVTWVGAAAEESVSVLGKFDGSHAGCRYAGSKLKELFLLVACDEGSLLAVVEFGQEYRSETEARQHTGLHLFREIIALQWHHHRRERRRHTKASDKVHGEKLGRIQMRR